MERRGFRVRVRRTWWDRPLPTDPDDRRREIERRQRYDALVGYDAEQARAAEFVDTAREGTDAAGR